MVQGAHAAAKRQAEIIRQTFDEIAILVKEAIDARATTVVESKAARVGFELAFADMRELMDLMTEANRAAFEVMSHRLFEVFDRDSPQRHPMPSRSSS